MRQVPKNNGSSLMPTFGQPLQVMVRRMLRDRCPVLSVYNGVYCGQMPQRIKMPLGTELGLGPGNNVTWGPSSPTAAPTRFLAHVCCGQTVSQLSDC